MGQGTSKEITGPVEARAKAPWQSLVSSSRTSTSSYDSWDSYPALIPTQGCTEVKARQGTNVVSRLSRALDYIKRKITRKDTCMNEDNSKDITNRLDALKSVDTKPLSKVKPLGELVSCTKFSRQELQQMYRGFKNDYPSGVVDRGAFKQLYSSLFPKGDCTLYANFIFDTFDTNSDGKITFEDFVLGLSESIHGSLDAKLKSLFRIYDFQRDGVLTKEELSTVFIAFYQMTGPDVIEGFHSMCGIQMMQEHVNELFQALDKNGDGFVTEESFVEACSCDKSLLSSLAFANQFDNIEGALHEINERSLRSCCLTTSSSFSRPGSLSADLSPTLLCRNFNWNASITDIGQNFGHGFCDLELLEIEQRRARCSTQ